MNHIKDIQYNGHDHDRSIKFTFVCFLVDIGFTLTHTVYIQLNRSQGRFCLYNHNHKRILFMLSRILMAVVVGVVTALVCILLGILLGVLGLPAVGAFLQAYAGLIGLLAALWYFLTGHSLVR